jgi:hypothetical protein
VQPVQLSLMPQMGVAPPPELIESLPATGVADAVGILSRLIAKAAATRIEGAGDE